MRCKFARVCICSRALTPPACRAHLFALEAALRSWLPAAESMTGLRRASVGFSSETYFLEGCGLVLRMPPAGAELLPPYDVLPQCDVLDELGTRPLAPRVPKLTARCEDASVLGAPFYVM